MWHDGGRAAAQDQPRANVPPPSGGLIGLGALQKGEIEKWWPIIKQAGIKPEG
jgi:hypothetical protein